MDSEFIIPAIIYSIGIFGFIVLIIRAFSEWAKSSNNKAENGNWELKDFFTSSAIMVRIF